ncbi:MAG: hypothetical protein ACFCU8_03640 [Thermosynechococcaceae cyanobacterium]
MDLQNHYMDNGEHNDNEESIKRWVSELTDFTPNHIDEIVSHLQRQKSYSPLLD